MSANNPPNPYFNGINFNSSFFSTISNYLTQAIADSRYLRLIGGTLSGFLGIKISPRVELDINGTSYINVPSTYNIASQGVGQALTVGNSAATGNAQMYIIDNNSATNSNLGIFLKADYANNIAIIGTNKQGGGGCPLILGAGSGYVGITPLLTTGGNIGINTTANINGALTAYSSTPSLPRITLTGTEFISPYNNSTDGIALILACNRSNNRQMYIADTSLLAVNTTNPTLRFLIGTPPGIDAIATDGTTKLNMTIGPNMTVLSNGNIGIGTTVFNSSLPVGGLEVNNNIFVGCGSTYNYNSQGYGQSLSISGLGTGGGQLYIFDKTVTGTNYIGMLYKADSNLNACSINTGRQGGGAQVPLYLNNSSTAPVVIGGNLQMVGAITQATANTDINIAQLAGNTTGGNVNLTAVGANGHINFLTNGGTKMHIDAGGYINPSGLFATTQSTIAPYVTGTSGYWLIPIPYIITNNYYNMMMLSVYNSDNGSWWSGHVVVNTTGSTAAYTTVANGGFIQLNTGLQFNSSSVVCIKISFSNAFNITSGMLLYFKYIG